MKITYENTLDDFIAAQMFHMDQMSQLKQADRKATIRGVGLLICLGMVLGILFGKVSHFFHWIPIIAAILILLSLRRKGRHQKLIYRRLVVAYQPMFEAMADKTACWEVNEAGIILSDADKEIRYDWERITSITLAPQMLVVHVGDSQMDWAALPAKPYIEGDYGSFHRHLLETFEEQAKAAERKDQIESSLWQIDLQALNQKGLPKLSFKKAACWMLVGLVVLWFIYRTSGQAAFESKVNELARAGYPVTMEALEREYVLPDGVENAADIYLQAFDAYQEPTDKQRQFLPVSGNWPDSQININMTPGPMATLATFQTPDPNLAEHDQQGHYPQQVMDAIKKHIDDNQKILALLDQAARIEHCLFPRSFEVPDPFMSYHMEISQAEGLLCERNLYLAQNQKNDELIQSIQSLTALTHILNYQPFSIDYLITISRIHGITENLEYVLNLTEFNESHLSQLYGLVANMYDPKMLQEAIINDRCGLIEVWNLDINKQMEFTGEIDPSYKIRLILHSFTGLQSHDAAYGLDQIDRILEALNLPTNHRVEFSKQIREEMNQLGPWRYYLEQSVGAYDRFLIGDLRVIGVLRCAETALAVQRYRIKHGQPPKDLETLVPEFMEAVPIDPFDGKLLRYIIDPEGGFTVYSIGEDAKDNGGLNEEKMEAAGAGGDEFDLTFTIKQ